MTNEIPQRPFWALSGAEVVALLRADTQDGLTEQEAKERVEVFGDNIIEKTESASVFYILLNQFKSPLILMLIFAGIVTIFIDHFRDAIFIFAAVLVNSALGFYQEYKAEQALSELKTYLKQRSRVVRARCSAPGPRRPDTTLAGRPCACRRASHLCKRRTGQRGSPYRRIAPGSEVNGAG